MKNVIMNKIRKASAAVCSAARKAASVIESVYVKIAEKLEKPVSVIRKFESRPLIFCLILSFIIYMIVEMLSRRSVVQGLTYMFSDPKVFIYNWLIVMLTLSLAMLFRKKEFVFALVSIFWLGLGVTNCVLLGYRTTPLNFMDFRTFKDVMGIMTVYFSNFQIALMVAALVLFVFLILFLFIKSPKDKVSLPKAAASVTALGLVLACATTVSVSSGSLATTFHNIQDAYKDYGFAYCFASSVVGRGISKPDDYSQESVQAILDKIDAAGGSTEADIQPSGKATEETPNVIILQLESFFDVNHLKGVTYSENPVPVFTSMKENYSSGLLTTPSFGAGTSNTEFEVLTGMSLDYFGPGEYPYTTVLRETTSESVAYNLSDYGYSTHAIHNHTGKFYGRYLVYPELGFDSFTSVEYMQNIERNPLNWANDSCLTGEITKAMDSTESQDFVFAVSVQGHGKYPSEVIDDTQTITVEGFNEQEAVGFEYYVNQLYDMDKFLGELTDALSASGEPTVLVAYGDHLPKFEISASDLDNNNIYQTEYVIWDNFGMAQENRDLNTYQLSSQVMNLLGMHNGIVSQFQQFCQNDANYYSDLHTLQYDILYGECYAYGGEKPFVKTEMQMGIDHISISGLSAVGESLYVSGENFTAASKIFINGDEVKTTFLNSGRIKCNYGDSMDEGDRVEVIQMSSKKTQLSSTGSWEWHADGSVAVYENLPNIFIDGVESEDDIERDIKLEEKEM